MQCRGPFHPATGHVDRLTGALFCGACYRPFVKWIAGHTKRKWGGANFYEEAATSVIAGGRRPLG
ncbi:MAG TPA: hypothetical protein VHG72_13880 [Polyangia bacterium]|nr:hypothetical protein [Polyangia bacterium]